MEWLYGRNVVAMVLAPGARRPALRLAATAPAIKALGALLPAGLPVDVCAAHELDELVGGREHQGVAAQVEAFRYAPLEEALAAEVAVVLDEVSDPHNVGAVARSALAAGAGALVLPRHRSAAVTPAAVKASAGTVEHLPVVQVTNIVNYLKEAKAAGAWVYGAAGEVAASYLDLDYGGRLVLVFGAEGRGLRPLVARTCDALARIPMQTPVESLNVSVAAALFLYEALRQRAAAPGSGARGDGPGPAPGSADGSR